MPKGFFKGSEIFLVKFERSERENRKIKGLNFFSLLSFKGQIYLKKNIIRAKKYFPFYKGCEKGPKFFLNKIKRAKKILSRRKNAPRGNLAEKMTDLFLPMNDKTQYLEIFCFCYLRYLSYLRILHLMTNIEKHYTLR